MYASIKVKKLPPVPRPATKQVRDPRSYSYGNHTYMMTPHIPGWADAGTKELVQRVQERRKTEAQKRQMKVVELARQGLSDAEIAEMTGYRHTSVNNIIGEYRRKGVKIPHRKKGPK